MQCGSSSAILIHCGCESMLRSVVLSLEESASMRGRAASSPISTSNTSLDTLVGEICASAPQYTDCDGLARQRLPSSENSELRDHGSRRAAHSHTLHHQAECYSLIWPLYAAGRSMA